MGVNRYSLLNSFNFGLFETFVIIRWEKKIASAILGEES